MTFPDIPAGTSLFIDANTFVYHFTPHPILQPACSALLARNPRTLANSAVLCVTRRDRRNRECRSGHGQHSADHGRMVFHRGNARVRIEQILHCRANNALGEPSAERGDGRHRPCGGRANAGSSIWISSKKPSGQFMLKRLEDNRVPVLPDGECIAGNAGTRQAA